MCYCEESTRIIILLVLLVGVKANTNHTKLSDANNQFAFELLKTFPGGRNVGFSPIGIYVSLAMAYAGATGETAQQLNTSLHYHKTEMTRETFHQSFNSLFDLLKSDRNGNRMEIANAILSEDGYEISPKYKHLVKENYHAFLSRNNTNAVRNVNRWIYRNTNRGIRNTLKEFSKDSRMMLINAVYFKGTWAQTERNDWLNLNVFYNYGKEVRLTPMVNLRGKLGYGNYQSNIEAVNLPFRGEQYEMFIIRPFGNYSLSDVENQIDYDVFEDIRKSLDVKHVDIKFPRFRMEKASKLKENLQYLGIENTFSRRASYFDINSKDDFYISDILHKSIIEVNGKGTRLSLSTIVDSFLDRRSNAKYIKMVVDHPFMYLIRERNTGMIVMIGRLSSL
ncbi:intracellular coagulation inhibitor 2-like [Centruroides vittatus]|uniref:intracellular coagulation inhibitor 2-like n=1 Tax=Centruroides vittatus TaxID=120091 RepID=UPI0035101E2D